MRNVESFFIANPPDDFLAGCVQRRMEGENKGRAPILYFADELAQAGSDGLVSVATALTDKGVLDEVEYLNQIGIQAKSEMSAVVWGSLIPELGRCLNYRSFDSRMVVHRINAYAAKAAIPDLPSPKMTIEEVSESKMHEIKRTFDNDPSYSLFFEEPVHLPDSIRSILTAMKFFSSNEAAKVVEKWKQRAWIIINNDPFAFYDSGDTSKMDAFLKMSSRIGFQVDELLTDD